MEYAKQDDLFYDNYERDIYNEVVAKASAPSERAMKLWELVKQMEEKENEDIENKIGELMEARVTMFVNFGPKGRCVPGLIDGTERLQAEIVKVFTYYNNLVEGHKE